MNLLTHGQQCFLLFSHIFTLNATNKKIDQSLSDFQTGIGAALHTNLNAGQLISHTRTVLVDMTASLEGSDGKLIPVSEVLELLTKNHDIPDNAVSKQASNTDFILAYHFNSVSKQHCEV